MLDLEFRHWKSETKSRLATHKQSKVEWVYSLTSAPPSGQREETAEFQTNGSKARVKGRSSQEPNRMQMSKTLCSAAWHSIRLMLGQVRRLTPALAVCKAFKQRILIQHGGIKCG